MYPNLAQYLFSTHTVLAYTWSNYDQERYFEGIMIPLQSIVVNGDDCMFILRDEYAFNYV